MTKDMIVALIAALGGVGTASGFWTYIQKRTAVNSAHTRLLMGLAYDKIATIGMAYIERGWVSKDEYEEYLKYLVEPYKELGGNGVADRISREVGGLSFRAIAFNHVSVKETNEHAGPQ